MRNKILEISHLAKNYQDLTGETIAVRDVSFDVYDQEFLAIVGPSGCGKSTILSILSGLDQKSSGHIQFNKENIVLGYMLQKDSLFPWRTILDNCLLGLEITNSLTDESRNYVISLLKTYGLSEFMDKYPSSLSGGMRQRTV